jgi:hypothetical protein
MQSSSSMEHIMMTSFVHRLTISNRWIMAVTPEEAVHHDPDVEATCTAKRTRLRANRAGYTVSQMQKTSARKSKRPSHRRCSALLLESTTPSLSRVSFQTTIARPGPLELLSWTSTTL